jgi:hypothetical protein
MKAPKPKRKGASPSPPWEPLEDPVTLIKEFERELKGALRITEGMRFLVQGKDSLAHRTVTPVLYKRRT